MQYIFKKPVCVTFFACILLENVVYAAECVSVSSHFGCYIESLKADIQKSLCTSLKKISATTLINSFISAYDSTAQDLGARINQK